MNISLRTDEITIKNKNEILDENSVGLESVPSGSFFTDAKNIPPRTKREIVIDMRLSSIGLPSFPPSQTIRSFELDEKEFDNATEIAAKLDI